MHVNTEPQHAEEVRVLCAGVSELASVKPELHEARGQGSMQERIEALECRVAEESNHLIETKERQKTAEEDLLVADAAFQTNDSIMITDIDGNILRVNESFTELTGYMPEEVIGKTPSILKSGRHRPEFYSRMWLDVQEKGFWVGEIWNKRKDGQVIPQRLTIQRVTDEAGVPIRYVADGQDIRGHQQSAADRMEIDAARQVQESLLPMDVFSSPGLEIAGAVHPCENVSGDCFDIIRMKQHAVGALVADVSGHGLGPALVMARTQAYLRAVAETYDDPGEILTNVNRLLGVSPDCWFVTVILVCMNLETRSFCCATAGHRGWLIRGTDDVEVLESRTVPLGIVKDATMHASPEIILAPGDIIVLPTDGVEETTNAAGRGFGYQPILDIVCARREASASEIAKAVLQAARDFAQGESQHDDMTVVVAKAQQTA